MKLARDIILTRIASHAWWIPWIGRSLVCLLPHGEWRGVVAGSRVGGKRRQHTDAATKRDRENPYFKDPKEPSVMSPRQAYSKSAGVGADAAVGGTWLKRGSFVMLVHVLARLPFGKFVQFSAPAGPRLA